MGRYRTAVTGLALAAVAGPAVILLGAGGAAATTGSARPAAVALVQEHFALTSNVAAPAKEHVKARGVLTAAGTAYPGKRKHRTWLVFKRGSVRMVTTQVSASASVPNPATCKFTEVLRGTYQLRGGSRRYAKAAGSGHYETKIWGKLTRKNGSCTAKLASVRQGTWTWGSMSW
jgi:hypothetical protein